MHVSFRFFCGSNQPTVKVVIDQFAQAPALLALIISGLAFMEGRGLDGIKEDMQKQYMYSLIQNCECCENFHGPDRVS
jgi:hypothetical protein